MKRDYEERRYLLVSLCEREAKPQGVRPSRGPHGVVLLLLIKTVPFQPPLQSALAEV